MAKINQLDISQTGKIKVGINSIDNALLTSDSKQLVSGMFRGPATSGFESSSNVTTGDNTPPETDKPIDTGGNTGSVSSNNLVPQLDDITYSIDFYSDNGVTKAKITFKIKDSSGGIATGVDILKSIPATLGGK
jgi:hypothetical protein